MPSYKGTFLSRKHDFPKDGTSMSGFVTEDQNKPPRQCGNCRWFTAPKSCGHGLVKLDPEVPKNPDGTGKVDADDCCDNFQNKR